MSNRTLGHAAEVSDRDPRPTPAGWPWWLLIGAIALAALLLRVLTIRQSLPYVDHPDEPNPINYVIDMLRTGDPNQRFFQKPSLFVYLLLSAISLHYRLGVAAGTYGDLRQMTVTTYLVTTLPGFFIVARWVSASFGALTVLAAAGLGLRGWGRGAGLVAGLMVALLPYHLKFSQWATTDITATCLACLCLSTAILAARDNRWSAYLAAGAFAGLAASAKYNAGAVACAIVAAAVYVVVDNVGRASGGRRSLIIGQLARLAGAGLAALACFVAGTPYALLRTADVGGGVVRQWNNYGGANGQYRGAWNLAGYGEFFLLEGLSPLLCLATVAGLIILGRRRPAVLVVWLGFAIPSLLVHLSRPTHFMQNMLPLLVACTLPVGVAVAEIGRLAARRGPSMSAAAVSAALAALLLPAAGASLAYVGREAAGDTRVQLLAWIDQNVPPGARIAAELKPVPGDTEQRWTDVPSLAAHDLAWYRAQGYAYLVASSKRWNQFEPPPSYVPLLGSHVIAEFGSTRREDMLGSRLLVIATGLTSADVPLPVAGDLRFGGARLLGVALGDPSADGAPPMLVPVASFKPGGVLGIRSFWQVEQPLPANLSLFVHLIDVQGRVPTQRDAPPWQGRFPTGSWRPGSMVVDANDVYLPPNLAPGTYRVVIGMFNPADSTRPPVTLDGGPVPSGEYEVATISVAP